LPWLWLPSLVSTALVPIMFRIGMMSDPPERRAGAEPMMAGIIFALPFVALCLIEALCAIYAAIEGSRRGARESLWAMSIAASAVAGLVAWLYWQEMRIGYGSALRTFHVTLLILAITTPVLAAWVAYLRRDAPVSSSSARPPSS
jgi:hypothetical protein